jgi:hypothetical protein
VHTYNRYVFHCPMLHLGYPATSPRMVGMLTLYTPLYVHTVRLLRTRLYFYVHMYIQYIHTYILS